MNAPNEPSPPKDPKDKPEDQIHEAKESFERGVGELFKAAGSLAGAVKREVEKSTGIGAGSSGRAVDKGKGAIGDLGRAFDDAGKEIVRAASHVAKVVGSELQTLGESIAFAGKSGLDPSSPEAASKTATEKGAGSEEPAAYAAPKPGNQEEWPKTREEYEKKYGRDGDDWPRSREEYVEKHGRPPRKKDSDPGFRIATDDPK